MTTQSKFWTPLIHKAAVAVAIAGVGMVLSAPAVKAQTQGKNIAVVQERFDAWKAGTGGPFDLLADNASWTIEGNSAAAGVYATKEAFMAEVIRPFNARMVDGIKPSIRSITAEDDRVVILFDADGMARDGKPYVNSYAWFFEMQKGQVVKANAFFDAIAFNDLWTRVAPIK